MGESAKVHAFTKPGCVFCTRAKRVLVAEDIVFDELDVTVGRRNADASAYFSGAYTVPQVFAGNRLLGGADELELLHSAGLLSELIGTASAELPIDDLSDEELASGAMDLPLSTVIPRVDGTHDPDPESWPILRMYQQFFGFWPNTFAYLAHWPEAYKLFVYAQNAAAIMNGIQHIGMPAMAAVGYATSNAHGCTYCMTHSVASPGSQMPNMVGMLQAARRGEAGPDNPYGPHELALADLAARATRNAVTEAVLDRVESTVGQARQGGGDFQDRVAAVSMIVASFGFLNVFNDLVGMQIEGDWAKVAAANGVEAGRHGAEEANPDNLAHELPAGGPTLAEMLAKYDDAVGDLDTFAPRELGFVPAWMYGWPKSERRRHAYLYTEVMGDRAHSVIPSELKHLMARASAIARGRDYLAAVEGMLAHRAAANGSAAIDRIERCYGAAIGADDGGFFGERERAALRLAWLSAQVPLVTPRRFVQPAIDRFNPAELVHLIVVCAIASMIQRPVAITHPGPDPEVERFVVEHRLQTDLLALRHPLR